LCEETGAKPVYALFNHKLGAESGGVYMRGEKKRGIWAGREKRRDQDVRLYVVVIPIRKKRRRCRRRHVKKRTKRKDSGGQK